MIGMQPPPGGGFPPPAPMPQRQGPTLSEFFAALSKVKFPKGPPAPSAPGRPGPLPRDAVTRQDTYSDDPATKYGGSILQLLLGGR